MKKLLIGILVCTMFLCILYSIVEQTQRGFKYQAAKVQAEKWREK